MIWIVHGDLSRPYVSLGEPTSRYPTLVGQSAVTAWAPVEGTWKNESYGEKCDFFEIAATGGVGCRRRVIEMLPPDARTGTELLEIRVRGAESVFLVNPLRAVDCLDHGRSDVRVFPSSGRIRGIAEAAFREDLVQDACIRPVVPWGRCEGAAARVIRGGQVRRL